MKSTSGRGRPTQARRRAGPPGSEAEAAALARKEIHLNPNAMPATAATILGPILVLFLVLAFPVAVAADALPQPQGRVILTVSGAITNTNAAAAARFDRQMLEALGMSAITTSTPWLDGVATFEGPLVRDLLKNVEAQGTMVEATALNDYKVKIPIADFADHGVVMALKVDGKHLRVRDKGPLWIIFPWDEKPELKTEIFYGKSIWQLRSLHVK